MQRKATKSTCKRSLTSKFVGKGIAFVSLKKNTPIIRIKLILLCFWLFLFPFLLNTQMSFETCSCTCIIYQHIWTGASLSSKGILHYQEQQTQLWLCSYPACPVNAQMEPTSAMLCFFDCPWGNSFGPNIQHLRSPQMITPALLWLKKCTFLATLIPQPKYCSPKRHTGAFWSKAEAQHGFCSDIQPSPRLHINQCKSTVVPL